MACMLANHYCSGTMCTVAAVAMIRTYTPTMYIHQKVQLFAYFVSAPNSDDARALFTKTVREIRKIHSSSRSAHMTLQTLCMRSLRSSTTLGGFRFSIGPIFNEIFVLAHSPQRRKHITATFMLDPFAMYRKLLYSDEYMPPIFDNHRAISYPVFSGRRVVVCMPEIGAYSVGRGLRERVKHLFCLSNNVLNTSVDIDNSQGSFLPTFIHDR